MIEHFNIIISSYDIDNPEGIVMSNDLKAGDIRRLLDLNMDDLSDAEIDRHGYWQSSGQNQRGYN